MIYTMDAESKSDAPLTLSLGNLAETTGARKAVLEQVEDLFDELYDGLYCDLVIAGCQPDDAEEHLQEAFFRLFQYLHKGKRVESPKPWLRGVLHHLQIDKWRQKYREVVYDEQEMDQRPVVESDGGWHPEAEVLRAEKLKQVQAALSVLTERQYRYLLLRVDGLRLREIAELEGVSVQTVAEICSRAMDRLRRSAGE